MKIRMPDIISVLTEDNERITVDPCEKAGGICVSASLDESGDVLSAHINAPSLPLCFVEFTWKLTESEQRNDDVKVYGDAWERGYGDLEWRKPERTGMMPWFFMLSNGSDSNRDFSGRKTSCFGVKVRPGALCSWRYRKDVITLYMDIRNGSLGVLLGERTLHLADIVFAEYENISAFESGEKFCRKMCDDPILPKETVYGFNDWYYAYGVNSAERILEDARKLAELTEGADKKAYVVIDDGWQINSCDGPWREGNERFPDMAQLAREISDMGLCPGIWIRPLKQSTPDSEVDDGWRQKNDPRFLDPSHPKALEYISEQISRIVGWGFKLIKYDFVTSDIFRAYGFERPEFMYCSDVVFHDRTLTTAEIILNLYKTIRKAAKDALLIGCNTIGHLCAGLVEIDRTGDDTSGQEWERTRKMGINTLAFRMMQHNAFFASDADCVGLTAAVPWELNSRWLNILSISGTPLFVSWDRSFTSDEIESAVRTALVRNSRSNDTLVPLDWMEKITPEEWLLNGEKIVFKWE